MTGSSSNALVYFYNERERLFQTECDLLEKRIRLFSWSRVTVMILILAFAYLGFSNPVFYWPVLLLLIGFILLVRKQTALTDKKQLKHYLSLLNKKEAKVLQFESIDFPDGIHFSDVHHPYSHDLDLFGQGSVFQYLNRCGTQLGEAKLANDLKRLNYSAETLLKREATVRELGAMVDFRQQVWALGRQINDAAFDRHLLFKWLEQKPFIYKRQVYTMMRWFIPAVTLSVGLLTLINWSFFSLFIMMVIVQLTIAGFHSRRITEFQQILTTTGNVMMSYARIFRLLSIQQVSSELLKSHQVTAMKASEKVNQLAVLVHALEARMNPMAQQFGNGLFLYDFHAVSRLEKWREDNGKELPGWIESLAEWDSLLSLATLHFNFPEYAFAKPNTEIILEGEAIGHLLIARNERVNNDFVLGKPANVFLVTGANMAGKSTFLRALGVNFVLGRIGSPVCAAKWKTPLIDLHTGMRTTDSLQEHQSYFFAELNRLRLIMQELNAGRQMFILLDEILKGTNSTDKQMGSRELLKQLKDKEALVVLATHDIALGDMEKFYPEQIANACFEGIIEQDQLLFDYKLHSGIAKKANATFLMQKMGIIPVAEQ